MGGYPKERVVPEQRNKKILDEVRKVAFKDSLIDILKNLDQDLVKGAVAGEKSSRNSSLLTANVTSSLNM